MIRKAAQRRGVSKGEWVRKVIDDALHLQSSDGGASEDLVARLAALNAPTADIDVMIRESEAAR